MQKINPEKYRKKTSNNLWKTKENSVHITIEYNIGSKEPVLVKLDFYKENKTKKTFLRP